MRQWEEEEEEEKKKGSSGVPMKRTTLGWLSLLMISISFLKSESVFSSRSVRYSRFTATSIPRHLPLRQSAPI
jgi:hypothetical protein